MCALYTCVCVLTCATHSILGPIRWSKITSITWAHLHGRFTSITEQWTRLTPFTIAECVLEMKRCTSCCLEKTSMRTQDTQQTSDDINIDLMFHLNLWLQFSQNHHKMQPITCVNKHHINLSARKNHKICHFSVIYWI